MNGLDGADTVSGALWIVIGVLFLLLLGGSRESGAKKKNSRNRAVRIDRTHYYDDEFIEEMVFWEEDEEN